MDVEKSIQKAKVKLMTMPDTVFYTSILFNLQQCVSSKIPTAAVDGKKLFINPDFWESLTKKEKLGLLLHEVMHIGLDHLTRRGSRKAKKWNIAGDIVINNYLSCAGYTLPVGALIDNQYVNMPTEQVYNALSDEAEEDNMGNDIIYPNNDKIEEVKESITSIVLQAQEQAVSANQSIGNLPGELTILLQQRVNPTLPWYTILSNYLNDFVNADYTWMKPNKLFMPSFYLPSALSESLEHIAIAVDCSCSVSDNEFATFMTEIDSIQKNLLPEKITVISFDTKIQQIHEVDNMTDVLYDLTFTGRGGTRIDCVMNWAKLNKPKVLVVFTDGEFYLSDDPDIPIIWVIHNNEYWKSDYGTVINYKIDS